MSREDAVEVIRGLQQKQYVRVTLEDGETLNGRVSQVEYALEERVRLELERREGGGRCQVQSVFADGVWGPVEARIAHAGTGLASAGEWESLGVVREVTPLQAALFPEVPDVSGYRD